MKSIIALFAILVVSACTTTPYLLGRESENYASKLFLDSETAKASGLTGSKLSSTAAIAEASRKNDNGIEKATLLALIATSDKACEQYMAGMITTSNTLSSGLGIAGLGLSSAASLSSPTRSANLLSGLSTFATGTQKQLSDTVLGGKAPALIYKAVMAKRLKERSRIITLLESSDGGFLQAASEIEYYHSQCGPIVGINALEEAVDNATASAPTQGKAEAQRALDPDS